MTKRFDFNWQIPVPECLLNGGTFDRWTEEKDNTELEPACLFKVDEYGFFIYWKSEGKASVPEAFGFDLLQLSIFEFLYDFHLQPNRRAM